MCSSIPVWKHNPQIHMLMAFGDGAFGKQLASDEVMKVRPHDDIGVFISGRET